MSLSFEEIVNQLDLALEFLKKRDANFDRFAVILVDNVVELTLRRHAEGADHQNRIDEGQVDARLARKAIRGAFPDKIKFAKAVDLFKTDEVANSVCHLHGMRNVSYHSGISYKETLNSLTIFYFKIACELLQEECFMLLEAGNRVPDSAKKYLEVFDSDNPEEYLNLVWKKLAKAADDLPSDLLGDLARSMDSTIQTIDEKIDFLATQSDPEMTRDEAVKYAQAEAYVFSTEGNEELCKIAGDNRRTIYPARELTNVLRDKCDWKFKTDIILDWEKESKLLHAEKNPYVAVSIYCKFMQNTASIRENIDVSCWSLKSDLQRHDSL